MSRLATLSGNPTLRQYAQGKAQSATRSRANFLAPGVEVPTLVGKYKEYTAKNRFFVPDTRRGLGGRATRIGFSAQDANYNVDPHALDFPIDNLEKIEGDQLMNMAMYGAGLIADTAALAHERTVISAALATLGAGSDFNFESDSVDPVEVIDAQIANILRVTAGSVGVRIGFGVTAFRRFKNNKNVKDRFKIGRGQQGIVSATIADIAPLFLANPMCEMFTMVEDTAPEGKDEDMQFILDDQIIIFGASESPTTMDPSFMKTFRLMGQWMVPGAYPSEDGRGEVLKMDWSEDVKVTNAAAGVRINAKSA